MALPTNLHDYTLGLFCSFFSSSFQVPAYSSSFLRLCIRYWDPRQKRLAFLFFVRLGPPFLLFLVSLFILLCFTFLFVFLVCAWRFDLICLYHTGMDWLNLGEQGTDLIPFLYRCPLLIYADVDVDV